MKMCAQKARHQTSAERQPLFVNMKEEMIGQVGRKSCAEQTRTSQVVVVENEAEEMMTEGVVKVKGRGSTFWSVDLFGQQVQLVKFIHCVAIITHV